MSFRRSALRRREDPSSPSTLREKSSCPWRRRQRNQSIASGAVQRSAQAEVGGSRDPRAEASPGHLLGKHNPGGTCPSGAAGMPHTVLDESQGHRSAAGISPRQQEPRKMRRGRRLVHHAERALLQLLFRVTKLCLTLRPHGLPQHARCPCLTVSQGLPKLAIHW